MVNKSARTQNESVEFVLRVESLDSIEKTSDDIVSARSLTARENNANIHLCLVGNIALLELDERHSVSVREESLDFLLVVNAFGKSTFFYLHKALEAFRQFGLISSTRLLQCTFFHFTYD